MNTKIVSTTTATATTANTTTTTTTIIPLANPSLHSANTR